MSDPKRPATGPAIMEQLLELRAEFEHLAEEARQHWAQDAERMRLVDRYIDPTMNLQATLAQTLAHLKELREAVQAMERTLRAEHHTTRTAVSLHMSDPAREQERGRN